MSTPGLLKQGIVTIQWGDVNLSSYDDGSGEFQNLVHDIDVRLSNAEAAPTCEFSMHATPLGFEVLAKLKEEKISEPITIEFSYAGGDKKAKYVFRFVGLNLTTGIRPELRVIGTSIIKGCWTDNKISYTMEEGVALSAFPQFLQGKLGKCAKDLKYRFVGKAKEDAAEILIKHVQTQRTPHSILMATLSRFGMDLQIGDTAIDGEIVISYSPVLEGELSVDKPVEGPPKPAVRNLFILGPGLMTSVSRNQSFTLGMSPKRNSNSTEPVSTETEEKGVVEPGTPQGDASEQKVNSGTLGSSNPGSNRTGVEKGPLNTKERQALSQVMTTTMTATFPMLPIGVGMKCRDIIVIPSLAGGKYLEDWAIEELAVFTDKAGACTYSITGTRPFTGKEPMIDSETQEKVRKVVEQLTTPELWQDYYFGVLSSQAEPMPLGS